MSTNIRTRWAAIGAVVAITLGAGGIGITNAATSSGEKPIFKPIEPCRLMDLRPAPFQVGPRSAPLGPAETYTLSGWGAVGQCNLPSGTTALSLNVTALNASQPTDLVLYPGDGAPPNASNLNPAPGQPPTPNAVNVDLDTAGEFSIVNKFGNVNVLIDVVGVYDDHTHPDDPNSPDVVAYIKANGAIRSGGERIESVTYDPVLGRYRISFTDFAFLITEDVAIATPAGSSPVFVSTNSVDSDLLIYLHDIDGNSIQGTFSISVWDSV